MLILTKPVFEIYDTLTLTFIWPLPSDGHALHMTLTFRWPWPSDDLDLQITLTFRWPCSILVSDNLPFRRDEEYNEDLPGHIE